MTLVRADVAMLLSLLLASCTMSPARSVSIEPLVGSWQLAAAAPAGGRIPTITVGRDGAVSGNSGINRFSTRLDVALLSTGRFRVGPVAGTRMAGPPEAMQFETAFLQSLAAADAAFASDSTLTLKQGERPLLEFTRVTVR